MFRNYSWEDINGAHPILSICVQEDEDNHEQFVKFIKELMALITSCDDTKGEILTEVEKMTGCKMVGFHPMY